MGSIALLPSALFRTEGGPDPRIQLGRVCQNGGKQSQVRAITPGGACPHFGEKRQAAYKPGSVRRAKRRGDHSSGTALARRLVRPTRMRNAKARLSADGRCIPIRPCSRRGLPCPLPCGRGGGLLPHRFTLAGALALSRRSDFCGAVPEPDKPARRDFPGALPSWSPDFPLLRDFSACRSGRPAA